MFSASRRCKREPARAASARCSRASTERRGVSRSLRCGASRGAAPRAASARWAGCFPIGRERPRACAAPRGAAEHPVGTQRAGQARPRGRAPRAAKPWAPGLALEASQDSTLLRHVVEPGDADRGNAVQGACDRLGAADRDPPSTPSATRVGYARTAQRASRARSGRSRLRASTTACRVILVYRAGRREARRSRPDYDGVRVAFTGSASVEEDRRAGDRRGLDVAAVAPPRIRCEQLARGQFRRRPATRPSPRSREKRPAEGDQAARGGVELHERGMLGPERLLHTPFPGTRSAPAGAIDHEELLLLPARLGILAGGGPDADRERAAAAVGRDGRQPRDCAAASQLGCGDAAGLKR